MEHYYRKYGDLESMIQDLNASIRRLNSYLKQNNKCCEINENTELSGFNNLLKKLDDPKNLELAFSIKLYNGFSVSNVSEVLNKCDGFNQCDRIKRAWCDCRDNCLVIKDTIDTLKSAINSISNNNVSDNTKVGCLVRICNVIGDCCTSRLSTEKLKTIYEDTIKEPYETSCKKPSPCCIIICLVSVLLLLLGVSLLSCKGNENKTNNCIELCQCEKHNRLINDKTVVSINSKECEVCLCNLSDIVINQNDTISIAKIDNTCLDIMMHLVLYNNTTTVLDTLFSLKTDFHYKCKNTPANVIKMIPMIKLEDVNLCKEDDCPPCSHYLYNIVMFALLIVALILVLLILRPILQRNTEYRNKTNEKILNERLKVQNDWQEILQAKYRLDIRREELKLSIMEKRKKSDIDDDVKTAEHQRHMEVLKAEQDHEYQKALLEQNNRNNLNDAQKLRDLNTQIIELIKSLSSNK